MDWMTFALVVVLATIATSFTDWLFMGVLWHDRYQLTPETWRPADKSASITRNVLGALLGGISCLAFAYLLVRIGATGYRPVLCWSVVAWLIGPAPIIAMNTLWVRMDPRLALSHSAGWLVRLVVTGLITAALF